MSFIVENTIFFIAVEWGIKDLMEKLNCDKFRSRLPGFYLLRDWGEKLPPPPKVFLKKKFEAISNKDLF